MLSRVDKQAFPRGKEAALTKSPGFLTYSSYVSKSTSPRVDPLEGRLPGRIKEGDEPLFFLTQSYDHCSIQFLHADRIGAKGGPEIIIKGNTGFS